MPDTAKFEGYYYGVLDLYYAIMETEDTSASAPKYKKPAVLGKTIGVTVTPNYRTGSVYASNIQTRAESRINTYTVEINPDKIPYKVLQEITGRTVDENGVSLINGETVAPYLALGFAVTLDNGENEYWWLYKGKFSEGNREMNTAGENLEYTHPTLSGTFIRRADTNDLAAIVETGRDGVAEEIPEKWFTAVYEKNATLTAPVI